MSLKRAMVAVLTAGLLLAPATEAQAHRRHRECSLPYSWWLTRVQCLSAGGEWIRR